MTQLTKDSTDRVYPCMIKSNNGAPNIASTYEAISIFNGQQAADEWLETLSNEGTVDYEFQGTTVRYFKDPPESR